MKININTIKKILLENKLPISLLFIFAVLFVVAAFPDISSIKNVFNKNSKVVSKSTFVSGLNINNVESFSVKLSGGDVFSITKDKGNWVSSGRKIDSSKITSLVDALNSLSSTEIVSNNDKNYDTYGVSNSMGTLFSVKYSGKERYFVVGSSVPQSTSFYIRNSDSKEVSLASGALRDVLISEPLSEWFDKTLVNINALSLKKIEISGATSFTIEKKDDDKFYKSVWGNETEIATEIQPTLKTMFSPLKGDSFANDAEKDTFNKSVLSSVKFLDKDNKVLGEIETFNSEDTYFARVVGGTDILKISTLKTLFSL